MSEFECRYENHLSEAIIGFCVNKNCHLTPQYCYKCLIDQQSCHASQCLRFETLEQLIQEYINNENGFSTKLKELEEKFKNCLYQLQKRVETNKTRLKNMIELLKKKEYLNFKLEISFLRQYYCKEQDKKQSKLINELNSIFVSLQNAAKEYSKIDEQPGIQSPVNQNINLAQTKFKIGQQLYKQGKYYDALRALEDSLTMGETLENIYIWKVMTLNKLNRYDEAIDLCNQILLINSFNDAAYNNKGAALNNQEKFEEALIQLQIALDINPNSGQAYYNKGYSLSRLQNFKEALIAFERAKQLNYQDDNTLISQGMALFHLLRYEEALLCFNQAISINKKNNEAHELKALSLDFLKRYKEAVESYDEAIFIKKTANNLKGKADTLLSLGRKKEAKQYYEEALKMGYTNQNLILCQLEKL